MTDIEFLAKGLFDRYSLEKDGKVYNWDYLHINRKVVWMNEVLINIDYLVKEISKKINSIKIVNDISTTYAIGYNNGMWAERNSTLQFMEYLRTELKKQLEDFKYEHRRETNE